MDTNPFESPSYSAGDGSSDLMSERIVDVLLQTKPWVRMFSILGFFATAMMVLFSLIGVIAILATGAGSIEALVLLIYVPIALMSFFSSLHLWRYAARIQEFSITPRAETLELALAAQKSFWRLVGIMMVAFIGLYLLILMGALFWGGMSALP